MSIRPATERDVPRILEIYAPYVENTAVSFEYTVPTPAAFTERFLKITARFPWLVWEENGVVLGYAYGSLPFERAAYQWSAAASVYLCAEAQGRGIGKALYAALERLLRLQGYRKVYAVITTANEASVAFHRAVGYRHTGTMPACGYKFGKWYGTVWMEKELNMWDTPPHPPLSVHEVAGAVRVMSYNTQHCLNFVTRKIDFDLIADTIRACGADIVGLQEIRGAGEDEDYQEQARILAEKLGFCYYFAEAIRFDGKNPYGNALLSRYPILSAETIAIPDPAVKGYDGYYETRCVLKTTVDVGGGLTVLVSHFGLNPDEQENAVRTVAPCLESTRCIFMGDLNVTPDNAVLVPIRERLCDTAGVFTAPKLSFPSDNPTVKIDYVFASKDLRVIDADIPAVVSSDHRPHVATVDMSRD